jgi:hypothetical protein
MLANTIGWGHKPTKTIGRVLGINSTTVTHRLVNVVKLYDILFGDTVAHVYSSVFKQNAPIKILFSWIAKTHHPVTLLTWAPTYRTTYKTLMSIEISPHMKSRKPGPGEKLFPFKFKGNSQIRTE